MSAPAALAALADACGVMTSYLDYLDRPVDVGAEAIRLALGAMGIDASSDAAATAALRELEQRNAARVLPPSVVQRADVAEVLTVRGDTVSAAAVTFADGAVRELPVDGGVVRLPEGLPTGYHTLHATVTGADAQTALIVTPARCPTPPSRGWGWMTQLYQARSRESWGMGDYADLRTLASWSGERGAAMVLVNPLHAATPGLPQENSPYYPTSRRFRSPLYLRIEDLPELHNLDQGDRSHVAELAERARRACAHRIDRDAVYEAKDEALRLLFAADATEQRREAYEGFRRAQGQGLEDFATYCALALRHPTPWQEWPVQLRDPRGPAVAAARRELANEVAFFMWLQWLCDEQLADVQRGATSAGMDVGVIHDLAVGVDPGGADAWALQADLASGVTIGAPPDGFNQRGQDWQLPPLLPTRLPETGYEPFRDMLRSVLRSAGGIRIDHVMGLWRLWWVPQDRSAAAGTYVRYPSAAMLGVLALEAERAGAVVVGEDLGTVEKGVREDMADRGVLSSRVLYFERVNDDPHGDRLPAAGYAERALTSITTHDLPTAAGWWADEDVRVQTQLGLFGESTTPEAQAQRKASERADMAALLRAEGLVDEVPQHPVTDLPTATELILAMHRFLARTPSVLVATGLGDALGDRSQPNMPGTSDEYPNWRLPLARTGPDGAPVPLGLEEILHDPLVAQIAQILRDRGGGAT